MKYTCKRCCTLLKEFKSCPVCMKEDQIIPIEINVQGSVNKHIIPPTNEM